MQSEKPDWQREKRLGYIIELQKWGHLGWETDSFHQVKISAAGAKLRLHLDTKWISEGVPAPAFSPLLKTSQGEE